MIGPGCLGQKNQSFFAEWLTVPFSLNSRVNFRSDSLTDNLERLSQLSCRNSGIYPPANRVPTLDFELIEDDARQLKAVKAKLKILDFKKLKKTQLRADYRFTRQRSMRLSRAVRGLESWQKMCSGHDFEKAEPLASQPCWIISPIVEGQEICDSKLKSIRVVEPK